MKTKRAQRMSGVTKAVFIVLFSILLVYALIMIFMLIWGLNSSLKHFRDFSDNYLGFPNLTADSDTSSRAEFFQLLNYTKVFKHLYMEGDVFFYRGSELIPHHMDANFWDMLLNTLLYAGGGALICAVVPALTAYLCAKYNYKLSHVIFVVYTLMMCMPIVGNYPTELTFLRNAGLYDTIWGNYIQKMTGSGLYYFVYFAFFKGLSNTYREAAELDGASELRIMVNIYFPMAIKMLSTVFLLQFVALWNDYQTPLLYLPTHPTLSYAVYWLTQSSSKIPELRPAPARIAACMLLAIPILVIYIIFKDKLMGNMSLGGIKE